MSDIFNPATWGVDGGDGNNGNGSQASATSDGSVGNLPAVSNDGDALGIEGQPSPESLPEPSAPIGKRFDTGNLTPEQREAKILADITAAMNGEETNVEGSATPQTPAAPDSAGDVSAGDGNSENSNANLPGSESAATLSSDGRGSADTGQDQQQDSTAESVGDGADGKGGVDLNELARMVYGQELNEDQALALLTIARDLGQLSPQQAAALNQTLYGQGQSQPPIPQQYSPQPQPQQPIPQPQQPIPQQQIPQQQPVNIELPEGLDPYVADALKPVFTTVEQQIAQMQNQIALQNQSLQQYQLQQQYQEERRIQEQINIAEQEWRKQNTDLSNEEFLLLKDSMVRSQVFPYFYNSSGQDAKAALSQALDYAKWNDPVIRERMIHKLANQERANQMQQAERKRKATALSGSGAGATANAPQRQLSPEEADKGMIRAIQEAMGIPANNN